jgi:hypothetical protein
MSPLVRTCLTAVEQGLAFRAVPFVVYALLLPQTRASGGLASTLAYASLLAAGAYTRTMPWSDWFGLLLPWGYMLLAACGVHAFARIAPANRTSIATFAFCAGSFLVVPGLLLRDALTPALMLGFELTLSSYSYCVEQPRHAPARSLGDCLAFLLVNPVLVYPMRGRGGVPAWSTLAALRCGAGAIIMSLQPLVGLLVATHGYGYDTIVPAPAGVRAVLHGTLVVLAQLLALYMGHSGLASFQIGAMALFGRRIPERYHYPFLASNPIELWRRWNTYVGAWVQRYVFFPLAIEIRRRVPRIPSEVAKGVAVLAAFLVCGLVHELAGYMRDLRLPLGAALGFLWAGAALVGWLLAERALTWLTGPRAPSRFSFWWRTGFGLLHTQALAIFGWVVLPALSGAGLPPALLRVLLPGVNGGS